ncbi:ABC transporter ATP-binding protein [Comamonas endophytica]|uniref:ABC transporter ATP-binding protein n=1 Tax=Comamonas endophytica TaxID=2949090 RepID=A0ABY6GBK1_9BURK|nr:MULTISPECIES: ABC transporter ATP-binding protein [unclassified Acidovorax]MCD2513910.1 ABC transporter ATP-binding protein [Acidovorax sp. D4N7]UYG52095.1 ABC transporter ATP-binding protein [Acidovorax sp. 5MLIR]
MKARSEMLEVNNVSLGYGDTTVVHDVSLPLARGEIGCLLGASGCGKTTLLRAIAGFEPVRAGRIALQGQEVSTPGHCLPPQRRDIGMVFQEHALFPHHDVAGNVAFGLHRLPAGERPARVAEMLELVGLQGMQKRWPHELSGGQQQRVALARALAPRPRLLLMDEPFSSLDASLRESIAREVRAILKQAQATALMVTHDQHEAFAMADHIGVMARGRLMQWGSAMQVYCTPATREVAQFVGEGVLLPATRHAGGGWQTVLGQLPATLPHYPNDAGAEVLVRPEQLGLGPGGLPARVLECKFRGSHLVYSLQLPCGERLLAQSTLAQVHAPAETVFVQLAV